MSSSSNNNGNGQKKKGLAQKWKELPGKTKCDILVTGGKIALTAATLGAAGPILFTDEFMGTTSTNDLSYEQEWALDAVTPDPIDLVGDNDDAANTGSFSTNNNTKKYHSKTMKGSNSRSGCGRGVVSKKGLGSGSRYN
mmetsp:Transcript_6621/g.8056  ORF Transcript_6621/g.8056 Transcript_6621/m.8056 type:complete len:139 (+) Transcript_6621:36-452(+)